jgi:hypothetical protein
MWCGMLGHPLIGAFFLILSVYLFLVIFIPWHMIPVDRIKLVNRFKWDKIKKPILTYGLPAIICLPLALLFWTNIVSWFPSPISKQDILALEPKRQAEIEFIIDGGGTDITAGIKGDLVIDSAWKITQVTMAGDNTGGTIQVSIWKSPSSSFPPTYVDNITANTPPKISMRGIYEDSILSGWNTTINPGDILRYNVDAVGGMARVVVSLTVKEP